MSNALTPSLAARRYVRLDTLIRLRWAAIISQFLTLIGVEYGLDFDLPTLGAHALVGAAAVLNIFLRVRYGRAQRLDPVRTAGVFAFDILELSALMAITGGLENPFAFLMLGPVLLSATALPLRMTLMLGLLAMLSATGMVFVNLPLPWDADNPLDLPPIYVMGIWLSILFAIGFIGAYTWQIVEESRQLNDALAATELVLAREQHLSQLDGLAAAAAHELGTPLATIAVVARELERALPADSPHAEDVRLLREQAQRCRDILGKLTELSAGGEPFGRMKISALIEEVVAPHRSFGIAIDVVRSAGSDDEPVGARNPAILYGLGNLLENAVDFAATRVTVTTGWDAEQVTVIITDDGPGFAPEILARIGEPYVSIRARDRQLQSGEDLAEFGLGLGLFIAKTLLERAGARLAISNIGAPGHGALIKITWRREDFEAVDEANA